MQCSALLVHRPGSDHHLGRVQRRQSPGLVEDAFPPDLFLVLCSVGSVQSVEVAVSAVLEPDKATKVVKGWLNETPNNGQNTEVM